MKYTTEIEIDSPIEKVVELFDNPDNVNKWMKGLKSYELLTGTHGLPGTKYRLTYKWEKVIETITARNLPEEFNHTYENKMVFNIVKNRFVSLSGNKTKYIAENEFRFKGITKILAFLLPTSYFKKQSMKHLGYLKNFVENQNELNERTT